MHSFCMQRVTVIYTVTIILYSNWFACPSACQNKKAKMHVKHKVNEKIKKVLLISERIAPFELGVICQSTVHIV